MPHKPSNGLVALIGFVVFNVVAFTIAALWLNHPGWACGGDKPAICGATPVAFSKWNIFDLPLPVFAVALAVLIVLVVVANLVARSARRRRAGVQRIP